MIVVVVKVVVAVTVVFCPFNSKRAHAHIRYTHTPSAKEPSQKQNPPKETTDYVY